MDIKSLFLIILSILFVYGQEIQQLEPGVLMEKYGEAVLIENHLDVTVTFDFSTFNNKGLEKLMSTMENLCKKVEEIFEEPNPLCEDQVVYNKQFMDEVSLQFGYLENSRSFAKKADNDDELEKINEFEFTAEISKNLAKKIDDISAHIAITIKEASNSSNIILMRAMDCSERMLALSYKFDELRSYVNYKLRDIQNILNDAAKKEFNWSLMSNGLKDMIKSTKVVKYRHIIDLNNMDSGDIASLSEISVFKVQNISYVVLSLPLTTKPDKTYELIQLRPIPKLEYDVLTMIKLESNFIARKKNSDGNYFHIESLNNCKFYNKKYFCENFYFVRKTSDNCISQILNNHHKQNSIDFSSLSSCKLSSLVLHANIVIKLNENNSYMVIKSRKTNPKLQMDNLQMTKKGVYFVRGSKFGTLKLDEFELNFENYLQDERELQVTTEVQTYSYSSPKRYFLLIFNSSNNTAMNILTLSGMSTFDELRELSMDVKDVDSYFIINSLQTLFFYGILICFFLNILIIHKLIFRETLGETLYRVFCNRNRGYNTRKLTYAEL